MNEIVTAENTENKCLKKSKF